MSTKVPESFPQLGTLKDVGKFQLKGPHNHRLRPEWLPCPGSEPYRIGKDEKLIADVWQL
jgi:hypothetical protein